MLLRKTLRTKKVENMLQQHNQSNMNMGRHQVTPISTEKTLLSPRLQFN
jgi:hypothetical protein